MALPVPSRNSCTASSSRLREQWKSKAAVGSSSTLTAAAIIRFCEKLNSNAPNREFHGWRTTNLNSLTHSPKVWLYSSNFGAAEIGVKQMNQRVKGSEKFWTAAGGESLLQLRADQLSDTAPLEVFWNRRASQATGTRKYRSRPRKVA